MFIRTVGMLATLPVINDQPYISHHLIVAGLFLKIALHG